MFGNLFYGQIRKTAGSNFNRYGVSHAGLGVWDTTSNYKYSIEFVSTNYVGSLLPTLNDGDVNFNNAGEIVITYPLNEDLWLNARLIATTSGSAYSQIITYLQDNIELYAYYQPVSVLYVNASLFNTSDSNEIEDTQLNTLGSLLISPCDSFRFVDLLVSQLESYGTDLGAFLQIYATAFNYLAATNNNNNNNDDLIPSSISIVSWESTEVANPDVYFWYSELKTCYQTIYDATDNSQQGAQYFFNQIKTCYSGAISPVTNKPTTTYAYIFRSPTSVYNITLGNYSTYYRSPFQSQYIYDLPNNGNGTAETLTTTDYVIIALVVFAIVMCTSYVLHKMFTKKMRRRVSFEGERFAERTVDSLVATPEDRTYFQ
jgi:hypothetical protein